MRYIFILFALLQFTAATGGDNIKLKGKIDLPSADSIEISFNDNNLAYYPKKFTARLDKAGRFSMSFSVPEGQFTIVQLQYGNSLADLLLRDGDSLVMTANAKHFDSSVHYSGRGGDIQNFIAGYVVKKGRINQYPSRIKSLIQKEPAEFIAGMNAEYTADESLAKQYKPALPVSFVQYWSAFHRYYNYFFIEQYPQTSYMLKVRRFTDTIPVESYKVTEYLPLAFNDSFVQLPPYILYLTGILETKLRADGYTFYSKDGTQRRLFEDSVYELAYKQMPPRSLENYIAQNIYGKAKDQYLPRTEEQLSRFRKHWPNSQFLPLLDKQVGIARRLAPGQPAPDLEITMQDGTRKHLSDLKGKVVYLGFWAGWCKQCVAEMAKEQMVKDLIRKKPLEFVYVSIGTDTAMEHTITDRYHIAGNFTNLPAGWNAKEVQAYGVQSLPAYYLIDEDGNFALQSTPSPVRTTELVIAIEKLFK